MPDLGPLGKRNTFVQDRAAMRSGASYSGVPGLTVEDTIMTVSAGHLALEGAKENLVPADLAIVRLRRWLTDVARRVANGEEPIEARPATPTLEIVGVSHIVHGDIDWTTLVPAHRAPGEDRQKAASPATAA